MHRRVFSVMRNFKRVRLFLFSCLILTSAGRSQVLNISPVAPKVGDQITVGYDEAAPSAAIAGSPSLVLEALVMRADDLPLLKEIMLKKEGSVWKGGFLLEDDRSRFLLFRVVAGDMKDDNSGKPWSVLVYGKDGNPLRDARVNKATCVAGFGMAEFRYEKDLPAATALLVEEHKDYPDNWRATTTQWMLMNRASPGEETRASIASALEGYVKTFRGNEEAIAGALTWLDQTGQKGKADSIRKAGVAANPKGKIAESVRQTEWGQERDPARRAILLERFMADFPPRGQTATSLSMILVGLYVQTGKVDSALALLNAMPNPDFMMYNQVAWGMIEKGQDLEKAVQIARKGVDLGRKPNPANKPPYMRQKDWERGNEQNLGGMLDTYAFGLFKLGKYSEAVPVYAEAYALFKGAEAEINDRYIDCLVRTGKDAEVIRVAREVIVSGKSTPATVDAYREAYKRVNGSDTGFDAALTEARAAGEKSVHDAMVKSRVNKAAVDFTLNDLGGKPVKLSDQKGKVVVIDFWATWCGPCKRSFPTLQKTYDKYRANTGVAIYALNTWERVAGSERKALVEKFMADNKYTFPVLYDESFVEKYGVDGIPTKFVIDKKGNIAFKSVGFSGADEMERELKMQLDLLLAE
jgi:thiol-disulfide isomerase/thioredoxin